MTSRHGGGPGSNTAGGTDVRNGEARPVGESVHHSKHRGTSVERAGENPSATNRDRNEDPRGNHYPPQESAVAAPPLHKELGTLEIREMNDSTGGNNVSAKMLQNIQWQVKSHMIQLQLLRHQSQQLQMLRHQNLQRQRRMSSGGEMDRDQTVIHPAGDGVRHCDPSNVEMCTDPGRDHVKWTLPRKLPSQGSLMTRRCQAKHRPPHQDGSQSDGPLSGPDPGSMLESESMPLLVLIPPADERQHPVCRLEHLEGVVQRQQQQLLVIQQHQPLDVVALEDLYRQQSRITQVRGYMLALLC